jgi:hypothetical protein
MESSFTLLGVAKAAETLDSVYCAVCGQHPAGRGGDATALRRRLEFRHRLVLGDFVLLLGLDGIPAITGGDLDTLAGVPGFKRMSMEAVATTCRQPSLLDGFNSLIRLIYLPVRPFYFPVRTLREFALGCGRISIT